MTQKEMKLVSAYKKGLRTPEAKAAHSKYYRTYQRLYRTKQRSTIEGRAALSALQQQATSKRRCTDNGGWVTDNVDEINLIKKMYRMNFYANHFLQDCVYTLDHSTEVIDGGSHAYDNLQVMTRTDNIVKSLLLNPRNRKTKEDKEIRPYQYPLFFNDNIIPKETR